MPPIIQNSKLSLERYRQLLNATVQEFYGVSFADCGAIEDFGTCSDIWTRQQRGNVLNWADLSNVINLAVVDIERYLNRKISPSFVCDTLGYPQRFSYPPKLWPSFPVSSDFQEIGIKTTSQLGTATQGGELTFEDRNDDGFKETAIITFVLGTPPSSDKDCWIRVFNVDGVEVRPINVVANDGVNLVIEFPSYLIFNPNLFSGFNSQVPVSVCGLSDADSFVDSLDVFEIYPNPLQAAKFLYYNDNTQCGCGSDTCNICTLNEQTACIRETEVPNRLRPIPANYDEATQEWCVLDDCNFCKPTQVQLNYFSNPCQRDDCLIAPCTIDVCQTWELALFYLVTARLGDYCDCGCEGGQIRKYQREVSSERGPNTYDQAGVTFDIIDNAPFGMRFGELEAYRLLRLPAENLDMVFI